MPAPRKVKATVIEKRRFGDTVALFKLKPEVKCRYRPGQFLHLAMDAYDPSFTWPESRVFSIANSPGNEHLEILVSQKGAFTRRMIAHLKEEDEVWLKLPFGDFNFNAASGANVVLLAGGTGISPFVSFLEEVARGKVVANALWLYYGIRNPELLIYESLLLHLIKAVDSFHLELYIEQGRPGGLPYIPGPIDVEQVVLQTKKLVNPMYYLSGPKAMIQAFSTALQMQGVPSSRISYDKWE